MTFAEWSSLLGAGGTIVAAAAAAYSARQAWKLVRYQFEPQLIVGSDQFQIRMAGDSLKAMWWEKPSEAARYINGGSTEYFFRLLNIGNGPAYDINVETLFDYETIFADVTQKIARYEPSLAFEYDNFGCKVSIQSKHIGGFALTSEAYGHIEFLTNVSGNRANSNLALDPNLSFFSLCYAYYLMKERIETKVTREVQIIPLKFRLTFIDSSGKRHRREDKYKLTISGGRWKEDLSDGVAMIGLSKVSGE
jgi:hypothetical protein